MELLSLLSWIVFGLLAGLIARMLMSANRRMNLIVTVFLGIVGAVVGGWLCTKLGIGVSAGFNVPSLIVAVIGAVIVLAIVNFIRSKF